MLMFDFRLLLFLLPAFLLAMLAQLWISSAYASARNIAASLSGFAAARLILDQAGLHNVGVQQTPGYLSDHYDPGEKVLRLSPDVYHGRSMAAVGIAAHEAGHALQDAQGYAPLVIRNAAVPAANFGSSAGMLLLLLGVVFHFQPLLLLGLALFGCVVFFQLVNLPVEFNASRRAKRLLVELDIVNRAEMSYVNSVLNAAALTYVAATLQSVLTLVYYGLRFFGGSRDE